MQCPRPCYHPTGEAPSCGIWYERTWTQRELSFAVLSLGDKPNEQSLSGWLSDALAIEWPAPETQRSIQNLLATGQLPEAILLQDWKHLDGPSTLAWVQYMQDWTCTVQTAAADDDSAPALCAIAPARHMIGHLPESEPGLHVHWGMGSPSALEVQLLCRSLGDFGQHERRAMWREHVLPALIGNDWTLADPLWQVIHGDMPALHACLKAEARSRDWNSDTLAGVGCRRRPSCRLRKARTSDRQRSSSGVPDALG